MAAKTSVFYLTERLSLAAGADPTASDTIDLGAYVDVADRQGILVHSVDFVYQGRDTATGAVTSLGGTTAADLTLEAQLTDLNRGALVFADDRALVASGNLMFDNSNNSATNVSDLFPDNFGPTSAMGGRIVINDQMYLRAKCFGTVAANTSVEVTVRIKCSVITLTQKDFMAIALQSTAADN
jgi:hypothetical protein